MPNNKQIKNFCDGKDLQGKCRWNHSRKRPLYCNWQGYCDAKTIKTARSCDGKELRWGKVF